MGRHQILCLANVGLCALSLSSVEAATFATHGDSRNRAEFLSKATLETITGKTRAVTAQFEVDPADVSNATGTVTVDLKTLDTGIDMRNKHMRENQLETDQYPTASFALKTVRAPGDTSASADSATKLTLTAGQPTKVTVAGTLTIHGVAHEITAPATVTYAPAGSDAKGKIPGNQLHLQTSFPLKLADYSIVRPEFLFMKVAEELTITIDMFVDDRPQK
ncbi:MAG: YceI family protein [candidate division Zixibacteria bacterium]|nr:YceI family protein [candidate division Zixibacteria bacterium]